MSLSAERGFNAMKMRTATIIGSALLLVVLGALVGPAYASGNGNGNGPGKADAEAAIAQSSSPGKSADAPGQVKKDEHPLPAAAVSSENSKGGGHAKSGFGSSAGVKPSNFTDHNTSAAAGSNSTKLYGSGQSAGQIAIQHGASFDAVLYGPGNSQPHKVLPCAHSAHGKGGGPDVHALKNKGKTACGSEPPSNKPSGDPSPSSTPTLSTWQAPGRAAGASGAVRGSARHVSQGGVMSAVASVGKGTLPFTGFPLWSAAVFALGLVGLGATLRRQARDVA
jgi:hypothetical protein